jgi:hypothetical protein
MTTHLKNINNSNDSNFNDSNFNLNIDSYVEGSILLHGDPDYYIQVNNEPINCDPDTPECNFNNYLISKYPYINLKLTTNIDNDKCIRVSLKNSIEGDISGAVSLSSHTNDWWISLGDYSLKSSSIISNVFPTEISNRIGFGDYSPTPLSGGLKLNSKYSVAYSVGYNDLYRPLAVFDPANNNPDYSNLKLLEGTLCLSRHIGSNLNIRTGYTYSYFNDESTQVGAVLNKNLVSSYSTAINFIPTDTLKFKLSYLTGKVPDVKEVSNEVDPVLKQGQPYINNISDINLLALSIENRLSETLLLNGGIGANTKEDTIYTKLMISKLLFKNTILDLELAYINGDGLTTTKNKKITTLKSKVYINY